MGTAGGIEVGGWRERATGAGGQREGRRRGKKAVTMGQGAHGPDATRSCSPSPPPGFCSPTAAWGHLVRGCSQSVCRDLFVPTGYAVFL